jgi:hypothetical protein
MSTTKNKAMCAPAGDDPSPPTTPDLKEASTGFDLGRFRLRQDFTSMTAVTKVLTNVPVKKPQRQMFIYVRPGEAWRADVAMIELKEDREFYLVDPAVAPFLVGEWVPYTLFTYALRGGSVALWPVRLPGEDGKDNDWWAGAREIATRHSGAWVRVQANMELGTYDLFEAGGDFGAPEWPDSDFGSLLEIAFAKRKRIVVSEDHIVVRKLRGEV